MELVEVKILTMVITSRYGTLDRGDILRTDAAYAKHLIEECHAAEYAQKHPAIEPEAADKPKRTRKAKDET